MNSRNNRLTILAADIRAAHADIERGAVAMAERALAAGSALLEAKAAVPHGKWATWITENAGLSERSARRYMQLAAAGLETATVADLGIRGATAQLVRSNRRRLVSEDPGYQEWLAGIVALLDEAEVKHSGFRALFIDWAREQGPAERYAERLLSDCKNATQRRHLQKVIEAQQKSSWLDLLEMIEKVPCNITSAAGAVH